MAVFNSEGLAIAYDDIGAGPGRPILLVHGFSSNRNENWRRLGWYGAFERKAIRAVALDCRGHGESAKPHDPALYARSQMAGDIFRLADHLGIERFHLMGYSMGSRIALAATLSAPERIATLTLGGVGEKLFETRALAGNPMAAAMEADDPESISDPMLKSFRRFADEQGEDRLALAALTRAEEEPIDAASLKSLAVPVLVVAGARDELAGDPHPLAARFGDGRAVVLPGCDHFS
ncbi:MAG: alpha/beta fold hydrolase, partial [Alphaproteobacteria bacterium]|nr:alpha/beta fold hydrolase [Alphaproteobacteria bacterium]